MNVICPICGQKCRVPESALGQAVKCPACLKPFQCGSISPRSLDTRPLPTGSVPVVDSIPDTRTVGAQGADNIHYRCSRCKKSLESPAQMAGEKVNCPDCGQRLQIPAAPSALTASAASSTVEVPVVVLTPNPPIPVVSAPLPAKKKKIGIKSASTTDLPRQENCLECGKDITERQRVQTCPDCGSAFCSAGCYREHQHHAHSSRR